MWLRLRQIALVAPELEPAVDELKSLFGLDVCFRDPGVAHFGLVNALLPLGNQFIEIVAPTRDGTAGGRYLERRGGAGGYMVITQCDDHAPRRKRVAQLGVRIVNQFETHEFRNMQMHPKDTGGSFFEIDQQLGEGAHDVDGPWEPAGGANWKAAQTNRSRHADRRRRGSGRRSRARRRALGGNRRTAGERRRRRRRSKLDNCTIRFVPCTDGRPEGLGGLDIVTRDRAAILATAKARGVPVQGNQVYACGMRFNLQ